MSHSVTIIQRRLPHYRVVLFERMHEMLEARQLRLRLLHGDGTVAEASKRDHGKVSWAEHLPTRYFADGRICWQPFMARAAGSDLVIVTQENKLVNNLFALANPWRAETLAFWGHGRNMQAQQPDGLFERFKRWTTRRVDWWFAYTEMTRSFVRDDGFPDDRITVLNNSIDTDELRRSVDAAQATPLPALRAALGLGTGPLGVFVGSLYPDKRLGFLVEAACAIQAQLPGFELAIAGDGPDRGLVEEAARRWPFIRYLGSVRGTRKAELLAAADLMLNPGLVGLGILDAFVAGLPLLTTDCHLHSPEVSYLDSGSNGLMTANSLLDYVAATVALLRDEGEQQQLRAGALAAGHQYSIEQMSTRFCDGIENCLSTVKRRSD